MGHSMKLCFSTLGCPQYTLGEVIHAAEAYHYDGIEIRTIQGQTDLTQIEDFRPSNLASIRENLKQRGIEVACISTSIRFTSKDENELIGQHESIVKFAEISIRLDCPYLRIFAGPIVQDEEYEKVYNRMVAEMRVAAETCRKIGVSLLIETHDTFSTSDRISRLLSDLDSPNVFVLWDILHTYRHGESFQATWRQIGDFIRHVHIKDSSVFSKDTFDIQLVGEGQLPISEALVQLRNHHYSGFLSFEWEKGWHPEIPGPDVAFPRYIRYMRSLLRGQES